jgi:hypothetical protein
MDALICRSREGLIAAIDVKVACATKVGVQEIEVAVTVNVGPIDVASVLANAGIARAICGIDLDPAAIAIVEEKQIGLIGWDGRAARIPSRKCILSFRTIRYAQWRRARWGRRGRRMWWRHRNCADRSDPKRSSKAICRKSGSLHFHRFSCGRGAR